MKKVLINLYDFEELEKDSQRKAINEHRNFLAEVLDVYDADDEYVKEEIKVNEYLFYSNGELANITQYTGKHPKSGAVELKIGKDIYTL